MKKQLKTILAVVVLSALSLAAFAQNNSNGNASVGYLSGNNNSGRNNVFLGYQAGRYGSGSGNVFIGWNVGSAGFSTSSNMLAIGNGATSSPLIWGNFSSNVININGKLGVGINNSSHIFHVNRPYEGWQARFQNGSSNVYLAHGGGYGIHINTGATNSSSRYGLEVRNSSQTHFYVRDDGKVGIGTKSPSATLDVVGTINAPNITGLTYDGGGIVGSNFDIDGVNWLKINDPGEGINFHDKGKIYLVDDAADDRFYIGPGNVGIGINPTYKLHAAGDVYANGGWLRVSGQKGLYFQSYGGGFHMTDNTWIRTYNNKSFYHNSGIMRTDGEFQVGDNGARFKIQSNGRVGIGVASPDSQLDVSRGNGGGGTAIFRGTNRASHFNHATDEHTYLRGGKPNSHVFLNDNGGNVGIGTTSPAEKLHINGSVRGNQSGALRISSGTGWVDVGAKSGGWAHFYTDRPRFYFDKALTTNTGQISSYDEDLQLQTSGVTRVTINNNTGDASFVGRGDFAGEVTGANLNTSEWDIAFDRSVDFTTQPLELPHDEDLIIFDRGQKRITSNDGYGNFQIMQGQDNNGIHIGDGGNNDGSAKLLFGGDNQHGYISLNAGKIQPDGADNVYNIGLSLSAANETLNIGNPNGPVGLANSGNKIADVSGDLFTNELFARGNNGIKISDANGAGITVEHGGNLRAPSITTDDLTINGDFIFDLDGEPDSQVPFVLNVDSAGNLGYQTAESLTPWMVRHVLDENGEEQHVISCDPDLDICECPPDIVVELDLVDIDGNLQLGDDAYIDNDNTPGGDDDEWFRVNGSIQFQGNEAAEVGMKLHDRDDVLGHFLGFDQVNGVSYFTNSNNNPASQSDQEHFLRADANNNIVMTSNAQALGDFTASNITATEGLVATSLTASRVRSNGSVTIHFDEDASQGAESFAIGKYGVANFAQLFQVAHNGDVTVATGDFDVTSGDLEVAAGALRIGTMNKQNTWTQVVVRDAATGTLSYRQAPTLTPWQWNQNDIRYGNSIAIGSTGSAPSTTLDIFGDLKVRTLNENAGINELVVTGTGGKLHKRNANSLVGSRDNTLEKLVVVDAGNMMRYRDLSSLNLSPFTIDHGAPSIEYTGTMTITGRGNFSSLNAANLAAAGARDIVIANGDGTLGLTSIDAFDISPWSQGAAGQISYAGTVIVDGGLRVRGLAQETSIQKLVTIDDAGNLYEFPVEEGSGLSPWTKTGNDLSYTDGTVTTAQFVANAGDDTEVGFAVKDASTNAEVFRVYGDGHILGKKLELTLSNWHDEVFEPDYDLRPLTELEEFIDENQHLPDIPSEEMVLKEGVEVGEMQGLLLKKIEELTLYIIEQNKELKEQNEEIAAQNQRITELESKLK